MQCQNLNHLLSIVINQIRKAKKEVKMPILVELNINDISIDEIIFPNEMKECFIYEHLLYYCSKFYPLPTILIKLCGESAYVVRGHQYLSIAKELKHSSIRAIIDKASTEKYIKAFLRRSSVTQLDWEKIRKEEHNTAVAFNWYTCFFDRPLTSREKVIFEDQIVGFLKHLNLPSFVEKVDQRIKNLSYPFSGLCAEFQAFVPVADERWYSDFRSVMIKFHLEYVPIMSFQGRKFLVGPNEGTLRQ